MIFAIHCVDKPDSLEVRLGARSDHLEFVAQFLDQVVFAGPLMSDDGEMCGSLLVLDFADRAAAEDFCAHDPYAKAGLFASVHVHVYDQTLP